MVVNWECQVVLRRLELVDGAPDPLFLNFVFDLFFFVQMLLLNVSYKKV